MTAFTRLGASIWDWKPWFSMDKDPRILWLALYTSAEAKRHVPGIFHGSYTTMAEAARLTVNDTMVAIDKMIDCETPMVEYDQEHRVLRLTMLPDAGEYPSNADIISSWWRKFLSVPECDVRDAHVPVLRWIIDRGAQLTKRGGKNRTGKPMRSHEECWAETFATVPVPAPRRRGVGRLAESDTSTSFQPGLFRASVTVTPCLPGPLEASSFPISDSGPDLEKSGTCHRVTHGGERERREGERVFFSSPESGEQGTCQPRPVLTLVPPPLGAMCTPADLVSALAEGAQALAPEDLWPALLATIGDLEAAGMVLADVAQAAAYAKAGAVLVRGDPRAKIATWAAMPGMLLDAIEQARKHEYAAAERIALAQEARRALGHTTA